MSLVQYDITGQRFGNLVALRRNGKDSRNRAIWLCRCDCGQEKNVRGDHLKSGHTRNCGCPLLTVLPYKPRPKRIKEKHKRDKKNIGQGKSTTPEYSVWIHMLDRCSNPQNDCYHYYGGRGITVCERWSTSFENFVSDMGLRPSLKYSIDRIENDGNYEPNNCRWATATEQNSNKRTNRLLIYNGKKMTISQVSKLTRVSSKKLYYAYSRGKDLTATLNKMLGLP